MSEVAHPRLAGVTIWSPEPNHVAAMLGDALVFGLRAQTRDDGTHFSGHLGDLVLSVHPCDESHTELAFVVEALDSAIAECAASGGRVIEGPSRLAYGRSAHLDGPAGFRIELVELPVGD